jgi:Flp pilus assembly protein TadG
MANSFWTFIKDRRANVAIIFAVAAVPVTFLTGMGVDYTLAVDRQVQLNAAADAAALSAITPSMMTQPDAAAATMATNTFNAQASQIGGVAYQAGAVSVAVNTVSGKRTVTVSYTAGSTNLFPGVLGSNQIAVSGSSQSTGGQAPNIDFYLLLDDSPSMAIAATQAGINTMVANTSKQGGCAFGCHESHPSSDNLGNPGGEDNYALARNLGVTLRMDLVSQAAQNLMSTAQSSETANNAAYRMAIYTFDQSFKTIQTLTSSLSTAKTQAGTVALEEVYANNYLTSTNNNKDTDTNYDAAMSGINTAMPAPGSGTSVPGDKPQEVLFLVTDGVEDEMVGGSRQQSLMSNSWCSTIKGRGIRIAVLYTAYLPLPTNAWYNQYISPFQPNIASTLQACASPGLYYQVQTGGDISAALASLFQYAVQSAYLSK